MLVIVIHLYNVKIFIAIHIYITGLTYIEFTCFFKGSALKQSIYFGVYIIPVFFYLYTTRKPYIILYCFAILLLSVV